MDFFEKNLQTAQETLEITKKCSYIKDGRKHFLPGEKFRDAIVVIPEDVSKFVEDLNRASTEGSAEISITDEDSFTAAGRIGGKTLVMNFANARYPGGGFLSGANAQEESLCRESTLYASLSSEKSREMYDYNNLHRNPCKYNAMILSPNVCVFRDINDELLKKPFATSVITIPALNKNGDSRNIPQDTIDEVMKNRLRSMFITAAHFEYKNLILGAWGCGAYGNDPETVAEYFCELIFDEHFERFFDKIVFAIFDRGEKRNLKAFRKVFNAYREPTSTLNSIKQEIKHLESAISKFNLSHNVTVFRLADISMLKFFQFVEWKNGFFQDDGFTDTSMLHIDAPDENFIDVSIQIPAGDGLGAYFAPFSQFPDECQFTLNRGTIYKILRLEQSESEIWKMVVRAVARAPKELD